MAYKKSEPVYHTEQWRAVRQLVINRQGGKCHECMQRYERFGGTKPRNAVMVHHIIPYKQRPDLAYDLDNLVALCFECHEEKHPERRQKSKKGTDRPAGIRVVKV